PNFAGNLTIAGGTLKLRATSGTANILNDVSTSVIFNADNLTSAASASNSSSAGGTLQYLGFATGSSELVGPLVPTAGAGTVLVTAGSSGTAALTFGATGVAGLGTVSAGTGVNFRTDTSAGGAATITLTGATNINGILNPHLYFNGGDF